MSDEFGPKLQKGEALIGLGEGRFIHIHPDGKTTTEGLKGLPPEAYFMLPLVARLVPQEFEGPGDFGKIQELEDTVGGIFGNIEEVYQALGPFLAGQGVSAEKVASKLLELSPVHTMRDTGQISNDSYTMFEERLETEIKRYYPGSTTSERKRHGFSSNRSVPKGPHRGKDGIDF